MPQCYVQTCGNYYSKTRNLKSTDSSVMYHVFPSSRQQALLWASLARGEDVTELPTNGRICSWHFSDKNYQRDLQHELLGLPKRKKLIQNAVPDRLLPPRNGGNKSNFYKKNSENCVKRANNRKTRKKQPNPPQRSFDEIKIKEELLKGPEDFGAISDFLSNSLDIINYIKTEPNQSDSDFQTSTPKIKTEDIKIKQELIDNSDNSQNKIKKKLIENSVPDQNKMKKESNDISSDPEQNLQDDKKRKNGIKVKSELNKKSISYPIRSSIRIAKKKSLLAENQTKDIAFTPKEKSGRDSFAFKIKYMAKLHLEYNTGEKKMPNRMLVMEDTDDVISNNRSNSNTSLPENKENNTEEKKVDVEESKENIIKNENDQSESIANNEEEAENLTVSKPEEAVTPKHELIEIDEEIEDIEKDNDSKRSLEEQDESLSKKPRLNENSDKNEETDFSKCDTLDEIDSFESKLMSDIEYLDQLARVKEREWNSIIHAKKIKEEQMLRLQRKKQVALLTRANPNSDVDWELALDIHIKSLNQIQNNITRNNYTENNRIPIAITNNGGVTIQPIPSTANSKTVKLSDGRFQNRNSKQLTNERSLLSPLNKQRSILPKPQNMFAEYSSNGSLKTGPKGQPIKDVNLIVEKFRQSNPEVPRRGKRIRTVQKNEAEAVSSTSKMLPLLSLNNKNISSGSVPLMPNKVDVNSELGMLLSSGSESARGRDLHNDSSRSSDSLPEGTSGNVSFKDVLVEFARMSQTERRATTSEQSNNIRQMDSYNIGGKNMSCPEVTLHPVVINDRGSTSTVSNSQSTLTSNSLLHGILTKNKPKSSAKPFTTLSPTLARLLTDTSSQPSDVSNINDLLANSQDDGENEDSLDRLVIDETNDGSSSKAKTANDSSGDNGPTQIPPCQGCKKNSAQFVCAGCTSQWYCSRECQVSDWDQHCEICTG
ncbi:1-phosphatidylinositol 3-phosphate 5-kinase-like isoform X2 [Chrysoperla carnea]|uniref:1-phosphatidylinositol 3-phosphate 5-kinase-like isoform X2 n=1 Tax=Chrysoperla carnea TaxID=189513 RepID=UPI001D0740AD|nr:1-phosphatidylinositol 3-phosphate 5-kinase-like isoform X2 [Chrysoperla carnea]